MTHQRERKREGRFYVTTDQVKDARQQTHSGQSWARFGTDASVGELQVSRHTDIHSLRSGADAEKTLSVDANAQCPDLGETFNAICSYCTHNWHDGGQRSRRRTIPTLMHLAWSCWNCCFVPTVNSLIIGKNKSDTFPSKTMIQRFPLSLVHDIKAENSLTKNSVRHGKPKLPREKWEIQMKFRVIAK